MSEWMEESTFPFPCKRESEKQKQKKQTKEKNHLPLILKLERGKQIMQDGHCFYCILFIIYNIIIYSA